MAAASDPRFVIPVDDIRTKKIERIIAPMVALVTELRGEYWESHEATQNAPLLLQRCAEALKNYLAVGSRAIEQISPVITDQSRIQIASALRNVQTSGRDFINTASVFVQNTLDAEQRIRTSQAGRLLLMNVVRMMLDADMLDLQQIMDKTDEIRNLISRLCEAKTEEELIERVTVLRMELEELTELTRRRLNDMKNPDEQDDLQVAMGWLKVTAPIMVASSKALIHHPCEIAHINRDFAKDEMETALVAVKNALYGQAVPAEISYSQKGQISNLAANLDTFQRHIYMDHKAYQPRYKPMLEELLEHIVTDSAKVADWPNTRVSRRQKIVDGCNNLRQALQELLHQYEINRTLPEPSDDLDDSIENTMHKIKDLRRHLRRAVADLVSDAFLDAKTPINMLRSKAIEGLVEDTEHTTHLFLEEADRMIEVAHKVCEMSSDRDANRAVRYNALCCQKLAPQVTHAAILLAQNPRSPAAQEAFEQFREAWVRQVRNLTMAVDDMISVVDFLAVSEEHIREDTEKAIQAIIGRNSDGVDRMAGSIRGRSLRVCEVVDAEMVSLGPSDYTKQVMEATRVLNQKVLSKFVNSATAVVTNVGREGADALDDEELRDETDNMISACALIDTAVRDIRIAVLRNTTLNDVDSDNEYVEDGATTQIDNMSQTSDNEGDNQQKILRQLPEEAKRTIQEHVDDVNKAHRRFMYEVACWDETGNELIKLAREMCLGCDDMKGFTLGRGPLKKASDVITTAQHIANICGKFITLATTIGEDCVESSTKQDLLAYIKQLQTISHQLRLVSRVKADVQHIGEKVQVTGLESVTSLLSNVKNLLNNVMLCVKSAYIGSTKYRRRDASQPRVQWVPVAPTDKLMGRGNVKMNSNIIRRTTDLRPKHQREQDYHQS